MNQTRKMKRYLRQLKKLIPFDYSGRTDLLQTISQRISNYLQEHPDATTADFEEEFGTPEEVADSLLEELSGSKPISTILDRKKIFVLFGCTLALIGLLLTGYSTFVARTTAVEVRKTTIVYENTEYEEDNTK